MKGTNTLTLNEATMMEAVEYWLTGMVFAAGNAIPKVTKVSIKNSPSYSNEFEIVLETAAVE